MIENALEQVWSGIISDKYEAYYQPQFDVETNEVLGFEVLARLNDPKGVVLPTRFISVLEKNGMISELDSFIFESVCRFIGKCIDEEADLVPVSINLSRFDFFEVGFPEDLEEIRREYDVPASLIGFEITEELVSRRKEKAIEIINKFHSYGYSIILDNFTGSDQSLDFLNEISYDAIKLDMFRLAKKFGNDNWKLITSIMEKAKALEIPMIPQGVETEEQAKFFETIGCKRAQGYFFAKPMVEKSAFELLKPSEEEMIEDLRLKAFYEIVSQIDQGIEHIEVRVPIGRTKLPYVLTCDTEFDESGKFVGAKCTVKRAGADEENKNQDDGFIKSIFKRKKK